jgi:hypothetical protein
MKRFHQFRIPLRQAVLFIFLASALFVLVAPSGQAQVDNQLGKTMRWSWFEPTYGSPVKEYVFQYRVELSEAVFDTTTYPPTTELWADVTMLYTKRYQTRVKAVDHEGNESSWSPWTSWYGPRYTSGP